MFFENEFIRLCRTYGKLNAIRYMKDATGASLTQCMEYANRIKADGLHLGGTITWFKCGDKLPELMQYVLVYNTESATLIARRFEHDWRALFADGENDMKDLAPTHWAYLNPPQ